MPGGRPSKYKPEFAEQARKLCRLGAIEKDLAEFFNVAETTIDNWKINHPEFLGALKNGKGFSDDRVERSLYERATGYTCPETKVLIVKGKVEKVEMFKHYPPDTTAMIFWLKNRKKEQWRDKQDHDVTIVNDEYREKLKEMSTEELTEELEKIKSINKDGKI